jgi:anti-sigma factor RsiW
MEWESNSASRGAQGAEPCAEFSERLYLFVSDEVDAEARTAIEVHAARCAACSAFLGEFQDLKDAMSATRMEPNAELLSNCRTSLSDALDEAEARTGRSLWARWLDWDVPFRWVAMHPAAATIVLLCLGFSIGAVPRMWRGLTPLSSSPNSTSGSNVSTETTMPVTTAALSEQILGGADITGISSVDGEDGASPQVEVQLRSQRPLLVQGDMANDNVKRVLMYVLQSNQRFDPDVRMESVDLLRARSSDDDVCQALCKIARTDRNPAVRLKALEALSTASEPRESVRQTMMDALVDDTNPGIRIEAINSLREMAAKGQVSPDPRLVGILRERAEKDPSTYIRLQSAAMIQDLAPQEKF